MLKVFLVRFLTLNISLLHHGGSVFLLCLAGHETLKAALYVFSRALTFDSSASVTITSSEEFVLDNLTKLPAVDSPGVSERVGNLYSEIWTEKYPTMILDTCSTILDPGRPSVNYYGDITYCAP